MQDPEPGNIYGEKASTWSVNLEINVAYTLAALLGLYLAYKFLAGRSASTERENEELEGASIAVEEAGEAVTEAATEVFSG
jgi:hypothetical protein